MANRVANCGVPQATSADITVYPTVGDIGVPHNGYQTAINDNTRSILLRLQTYPAFRLKSDLGIGVPYNPQNGVTST